MSVIVLINLFDTADKNLRVICECVSYVGSLEQREKFKLIVLEWKKSAENIQSKMRKYLKFLFLLIYLSTFLWSFDSVPPFLLFSLSLLSFLCLMCPIFYNYQSTNI